MPTRARRWADSAAFTAAVCLLLIPVGYLAFGRHVFLAFFDTFQYARSDCPRMEAIFGLARLRAIAAARAELLSSAKYGSVDSRGLRITATASGDYWEPAGPGGTIVVPQLAELSGKYRWRRESPIRAGDIVLDCGANIGAFTREALHRGASRVIAFEPAADNIECFRRNLKDELDSGRVVLIEQGVWNRTGALEFYLAGNSAQNSFLPPGDERKPSPVRVPVTTIDAVVDLLGLPRVDMIKMDIEGAEPQALQGAAETMRRFRPRLELEAGGGAGVLIDLARKAWPGYRVECLVCTLRLDEGTPRLLAHDLFLSP